MVLRYKTVRQNIHKVLQISSAFLPSLIYFTSHESHVQGKTILLLGILELVIGKGTRSRNAFQIEYGEQHPMLSKNTDMCR